jgi:putative phage-type endonuclease
MTAPVVQGWFTPGSEEWREFRRWRLGGSEIAAVLGLSPYESPLSLWLRKMDLAGPQQKRAEMEWGNRLEPVVADKFFEGEGRWPWGIGTPATYTHPDRPWQAASPDRFISYREVAAEQADAILEVKTSPYGDGWGVPGTDEILVYYRCQVLWYLSVLGLTKAHIAVLIGGYDYREYVIELDAQARADTDILIDAGAKFIESMRRDRRPDIDSHDQTYQVLREQHPDITAGEEVDLGTPLGFDYLMTKDDLTDAEKKHNTIRAQVLDAMGNANYGTWLGERIVRRQAKGDDGLPFLVSTRKDPRDRIHPSIQGATRS